MTQCHLSWNSFNKNICNGFSRLQQREEFVDMTLAADGHLVKVHKSLIALSSPYLKEMLQSAPCSHPVLFLNNVSHEVLCFILEYIYTGEVHIPLEKTSVFINAAKVLHIVGIENLIPPQHPFTFERENKIFSQNVASNGSVNELPTGVFVKNSPNSRLDTIDDESQEELDQNSDRGLVSPSLSNSEIIVTINNDNEPNIVNVNIIDNDAASVLTEDTADTTLQNSEVDSYQALSNQGYSVESTSQLSQQESQDQMNVDYEPQPNCELHTDFVKLETQEVSHSAEDINAPIPSSEICPPNLITITDVVMEPQYTHNLEIKMPNGDEDHPIITINVLNDQGSIPQFKAAEQMTSSESSDCLVSATTPLYTVSNRGSVLLILNRYMYHLQYSSSYGRKRRWRCLDYRLQRCKAFVDTDGEIIMSRKHEHSHLFHDNKILERSRTQEMFTSIADIMHYIKHPTDKQARQNDDEES